MSDLPGLPGGQEQNPPQQAARRAGSVVLRSGPEESPGGASAMLDPANQSLADALKVMFRLLQAAMVVLVGLFLLSGVQAVKEGERGVRLLFGRMQDHNLEPGFRWSAPFPLGELIRVNQNYREIVLDRPFWVYVAEGTVDPSPDKLVPTSSLKPDQGGSGSVITADGNIAHTRWKVGFRRGDTKSYCENILPEQETALVRTAAMRGIVRACANVTIAELLTQSGNQENSVTRRARSIAQDMLDRSGSGVVIDQFVLEGAIPPLFVRSDFANVQSAVSKAGKEIDNARADRRKRLNEVAGDAANDLIDLIDEYEAATAANDQAKMTATLAKIDALLLDRQREENGVVVPGRTSGRVALMLDEANLYRSQIVSQRQAQLARFEAKLAQFESNPLVMVQSEWREAFQVFSSRRSIDFMILPPNAGEVWLSLNRDPDKQREIEREKKTQELDQQQRQRERELRDTRYQTRPLQEAPV